MTGNRSHRNILIYGGIAAAVMFSFCFAMVPIYSLLCKTIGINTSAPTADLITPAVADNTQYAIDKTRDITVQFVTMNHNGMPWDFYPRTKSLRVHPGAQNKVYFYAKNTTNHLMTVQAIPSMTPPQALSHFHKIECFCFRQQTLQAGESKEMALVFQIDKELPKEVHVLTLAYTLFDATPKETKKR
jgi:cytochrome c oxidase assembly protein subunit 11